MEQREEKQGQQLRLMVINKIGNQLEEQALVAIKCTNQDLKQNTKSVTGRGTVNKGDDRLDEPLGKDE